MSIVSAVRWVAAVLAAFLHFHAAADCLDDEARLNGIDPILFRSLAWQESDNNPNAVGPLLDDGNVAVGLLQVNTNHLPRLKAIGITKEKLFDRCINAKAAAPILADCIRQFGRTWKAVGCYNTGPRSRNIDAQERFVASVAHFYNQVATDPDARPRRRKTKTAKSPPSARSAASTPASTAPRAITPKVWESDE